MHRQGATFFDEMRPPQPACGRYCRGVETNKYEREVCLFRRKKKGPPDSHEVMARAVILKYVMVTGMACRSPEVIASLDEGEQASLLGVLMQHQREMEASLRRGDLWSRMAEREQKIIRKPTEMTPQTMVDISWMAESEECLLWALSLIDGIPPWDTQADIEHLKKLP